MPVPVPACTARCSPVAIAARDGLGHRVLALAALPADRGDRGLEQLGDAGQRPSGTGRGYRAPVETEAGAGGTRGGYRAAPVAEAGTAAPAATRLVRRRARVTGRACRHPARTCHHRRGDRHATPTRAAVAVPGSPRARGPATATSTRAGASAATRSCAGSRTPGSQLGREALGADLADRAEGLRPAAAGRRCASTCWPRCASRADYRIGIGVTRIGTVVGQLPLRGVRRRRVRGHRRVDQRVRRRRRPAPAARRAARAAGPPPHRGPGRRPARARAGAAGPRGLPVPARRPHPLRRPRHQPARQQRPAGRLVPRRRWPSCTSTCSATRSAARSTGSRRARCACTTSARCTTRASTSCGSACSTSTTTSVRYACGLFDGPRCVGLAEAVGAHHATDADGKPVDLAAALEPFRMRTR